MESYPHWTDEYLVTKDRILLTQEQLPIPGIRMLGRHAVHNATQSLGWHYHQDAFEFSLPAQGTFSFSTLTNNYPFSGGEVFVSFPNEVHGTNEVPVTVGELYWFQLDISDEDHFLYLNPEAAHDMIVKLREIPHHVIRTELKKTLPLMEKAFELALGGADNHLTASFLQLLLHLILLYAHEEAGKPSPDIQLILNHIQEHIEDTFSLEDLAALANLSCSQFKQKFKKQIGTAPRHFMNQKKIEYAKKLLLDGKSVTETAMQLNFSTSAYFSTVFKKYTLYTPSEYLRLKKEKLP